MLPVYECTPALSSWVHTGNYNHITNTGTDIKQHIIIIIKIELFVIDNLYKLSAPT